MKTGPALARLFAAPGCPQDCVTGVRLAPTAGGAWRQVVVCAVLWVGVLTATSLQAQESHPLNRADLTPGLVGSRQLQRGGPLSGFFQPVKISGPAGLEISLAENGDFAEPQLAPVRVGMLIAPVYRLKVMGIPGFEGAEIYPTVEVIDRLFAPAGQARRFPIPIELTQEDLELALGGRFVTRVIYLEDPDHALPVADNGTQQWFDAGTGVDPLQVADRLGRPVAIVRMGGRLPTEDGPDLEFLGGCPPFTVFRPAPTFEDATQEPAEADAEAPLPADVEPLEVVE